MNFKNKNKKYNKNDITKNDNIKNSSIIKNNIIKSLEKLEIIEKIESLESLESLDFLEFLESLESLDFLESLESLDFLDLLETEEIIFYIIINKLENKINLLKYENDKIKYILKKYTELNEFYLKKLINYPDFRLYILRYQKISYNFIKDYKDFIDFYFLSMNPFLRYNEEILENYKNDINWEIVYIYNSDLNDDFFNKFINLKMYNFIKY